MSPGRFLVLDGPDGSGKSTQTRLLIEHLDGPTTLLSDHVSNFLDVRGRIPADTSAMLAQIDAALEWPARAFRPPTERLVGLGL